MKKIIYLSITILLTSIVVKAQQGFGTSAPDKSALIDMTNVTPSTKAKGVLMPRVTLTSINDVLTVTSPANALTVFNTATAGTAPNDVTPGYYYWSVLDNKWIRLITAADTKVSNASSINTATVSVNGVTSTGAPIVNSNNTTLTGTNLTTTVNGVVSAALNLQPAITAGTTHTLTNPTNTITSVVNGVSVTAPAVNTVVNSVTGNNLTTTVNGVAGTIALPINNIYANNGTLAGNRTVTQAANTLTFTGTAAAMVKITNTAGTVATPVSALQIMDGSQATGKVLTSDANGNTSWTFSALKAIPGTLPTTTSNFTTYGATDNVNMYTGGTITLPPGKWMVSFGSTVSTGGVGVINSDGSLWCTLFLTDGAAISSTSPDLIPAYTGFRGAAGTIGRGMIKAFVSGYCAVNNISGANKIYYLYANQEKNGATPTLSTGGNAYWKNVFDPANWERYFYAIPIQ